jgi:hypothetical protein
MTKDDPVVPSHNFEMYGKKYWVSLHRQRSRTSRHHFRCHGLGWVIWMISRSGQNLR